MLSPTELPGQGLFLESLLIKYGLISLILPALSVLDVECILVTLLS